jgi:putative ABC transport system substrate-binding protein
MTSRAWIALLTVGALTLGGGPPAHAQPAKKPPRIGILFYGASASTGPPRALLDALRDVGLVGGRSAVFEIRFAEGRTERFAPLAAELVSLRVDLLVTTTTPGALAAKQATRTIPTVMVAVSDPIGSRLVASLARPGGNMTGLSLLAPELSAKRLDLLKQAFPQASRVAVLWNVGNDGMVLRFRETETAAGALGIRIESVGVRTPEDFEGAFASMTMSRPEALLVLADTVTVGQRQRIAQFAAANRIPAIYELREFIDAGGLMAYGIDMAEHFRRAAVYIDKILKGAKPADIPIEQPSKFEFVINMNVLKGLGLSLPPALVLRADEVIE